MSEPVDPGPSDMAHALYGKDATTGIVAVQLDRSEKEDEPARMVVYRRPELGGATGVQTDAFFPFFFLSDPGLLNDVPRGSYRLTRLAGGNPYRYLATFDRLRRYWDARRAAEGKAPGAARRGGVLHVGSPVTQYLLQSGKTLFKGMRFEQLKRMQVDIEVVSEAEFPHPDRGRDEVVIIAMRDNQGWTRVLHAGDMGEEELLARFVETVRERDPDVVEGHNILGFDLPYLAARCRRFGIGFALGRDGSEPRRFASSMRFAERSIDYEEIEIAGRHVIDTYFQVMAYDVFKRDLPGYGLKVAARYFGFAENDRTYVDGPDITETWRKDPDRLIRYALDDVKETSLLATHLSGSGFYLTQMIPMAYGQVARSGPGAKIEALFVREYLRMRHALPRSEWGSQVAGGYTDVLVTGIVGPVVYADVESLYPSIMMTFGIRPESDELDLFQGLLRELTKLRLSTKREMERASTPLERSELDARQNSYKNLINSFYGQLGYSLGLFNDYSEADRVALEGQRILRRMIESIRVMGGRVVEVDTDGVFFIPPENAADEPNQRALVEALTASLPAGIRVGFAGRYRKMLSYKKKNYALLAYDGSMVLKGSSLASRSIERFARRFVRQAIRLLLEERVEDVHRLYLETQERILAHRWGVEDFCRTETIKEHISAYEDAVRQGKRPRSAAYEIAIRLSARTGVAVRRGERVRFYIAASDDQRPGAERARPADEWRADQPDEDTAHYLRRLEEVASKFEVLFEPSGYRQVFPPPSFGQAALFAPDLGRARLIVQAARGEAEGSEGNGDDDGDGDGD